MPPSGAAAPAGSARPRRIAPAIAPVRSGRRVPRKSGTKVERKMPRPTTETNRSRACESPSCYLLNSCFTLPHVVFSTPTLHWGTAGWHVALCGFDVYTGQAGGPEQVGFVGCAVHAPPLLMRHSGSIGLHVGWTLLKV